MVSFVEPRSFDARSDVQHLPGVMDVEMVRSVPARLVNGGRTRTLAITGLPPRPRLSRVVTRSGEPVTLSPDGLVMSQMLGGILGVKAGDVVRVEVLEGERPIRDVPVAALVDDTLGLQAYMDINALHRLMREGRVLTGAALTIDPAATDLSLIHI